MTLEWNGGKGETGAAVGQSDEDRGLWTPVSRVDGEYTLGTRKGCERLKEERHGRWTR